MEIKTISKTSIQTSQNQIPITFISDIMQMSIKEDDEHFYLTEDSYNYIKEKYGKPIEEGVGTELKKLLSKIGIRSTPNCSCNHKAKLMNMNGVEWCENNIDTILRWLEEEAKKRKLPFIEYGAKLIIKRAISNAKRNSNGK